MTVDRCTLVVLREIYVPGWFFLGRESPNALALHIPFIAFPLDLHQGRVHGSILCPVTVDGCWTLRM